MISSIEINCRPEEDCLVPHSTGHLLYSATLESIQNVNPELSGKIHSSDVATVSVTPLRGEFRRKDENRKEVFSDAEYRFFINLIDSDGFEELFKDLVLSGTNLEIAGEDFEVTAMETEEKDWQEFMEKKTPNALFFHFMSPVSINYKDSGVTEMFPHREAIFKALENSWNQNAPEDMGLEVEIEDLKRNVIEKSFKHDTANTVITREGKERNQIKAFGFTGKAQYEFKGADDLLKKKLGILTKYAKYSGIGSHTSRGLGNVYTEVKY